MSSSSGEGDAGDDLHKAEEPSQYNQPRKTRILRGYIQWGVA